MLSRRYRGDAYFCKKAHTISQNFHDDKLLFLSYTEYGLHYV